MTAITNTESTVRASWRDQIRITRAGVFGLLSLFFGVLLLLRIAPGYDPTLITTLTFQDQIPDLRVYAVGFMNIVGVIYILGGLFALIPIENRMLHTVKLIWLGINLALFVPTVLVITAIGTSTNMLETLNSGFRLATPIVIGALAGIWCERSGVVNIAIEGMMLTGACLGFITVFLMAPYLQSQQAQFLGVLIATLMGGMMALLHAWLSITFRTDQIVSGTVINILALGLTSFLRSEILLAAPGGEGGVSTGTLPIIALPILSDLPLIGPILFTGQPIFLMMFVLVIGTHVILYYTRWGLRTRAVGENPKAADTLGINVIRNRYINVIIGGLLAGFAGAWFSLEATSSFDNGMTGGLGFIALAAMIFGKWTPLGATIGGLLFGFSQAFRTRFQILDVPIPEEFIQMIPYIVTMIVLAGLVGKATAPKADGVPYKKE